MAIGRAGRNTNVVSFVNIHRITYSLNNERMDRRKREREDRNNDQDRALRNLQLSSVLLQILLYLSSAYSVFYFLSTLSMIIYKTYVLSYPDDRLALDVCLLVLMASLEVLRVYWGIRGNLQESKSYTASNLVATGAAVLLGLYFVIWQSYVLRADVIIASILICLYGLTGIVGLGTLARFTSAYS